MKDTLQLALTLAICVTNSDGQVASYVCKHTNVTGSEFEVVFKYFRNDDTLVTGLSSYDASVPLNRSYAVGGDACSTQNMTGNIFTLQYAVDVNTALPCGISQDPVSPSLYRFAILADGNATVYTFACNISELQLPNEDTVDSFATAHLMNITEFKLDNSPDAKLEVVTPDGRPVSAVRVGEFVQLQFSYNILNITNVQDAPAADIRTTTTIPDNFGILFHTAFPLSATNLLVKLYTLSESLTDVEVTFLFESTVQSTTVQTSKSTPWAYNVPFAVLSFKLDINYNFNYLPTATISVWPKITFGLKVKSLGEDIAVVVEINGGQHLMVLQPDDVLGTEYRLHAVAGPTTSNPRCLIIATEDNTAVTFDLSNHSLSAQIAGKNTPPGGESTVVIHEFEAIEITCVSDCRTLSIKSNQSVLALCEFGSVLQVPETNKLYREFIIHQPIGPYPRVFRLASGVISANVQYTFANTSFSFAGTEVRIHSIVPGPGTYLSSTAPILIVQLSDLAAVLTSMLMIAPSIIQWSTRFYFYLDFQLYTLLVASAESDFDSITMKSEFLNGKLSELSGSTTSIITSEQGVSYTDFKYVLTSTSGWYEFNSETGAPFGVYVVKHGTLTLPIVPFGMRFPCIDSSTGAIVSCDSSPTPVNSTSPFAIKLQTNELSVSDTDSFREPNVLTLHRQGCSTNEAGSAIPMVSSFKGETTVSDRMKMKTDAFRIFRFKGSRYLYIRLTIDICPVGDCTDSCTSRKKRSTESHHVDVRLEVTDGIDDDVTPDTLNKRGKRQKPCESTIIYWVPHMILVMIIIVEVVATSYFLMKKWKLKQS